MRSRTSASACVPLALALACTTWSMVGWAGSKEAQTLLREGKRLMSANQLGQACSKLAESQRLAPAPTTLVQLAICHEKQGKSATAYREFKTVLQQAPARDASAGVAQTHLGSLERKVAHLTIKIPDLPDTQGWQVTLDGLWVEKSAWNLPQPIDSGTHEIAVSGGPQPWSRKFAIGKGAEQKTIEVPVSSASKQTVSESLASARKEAQLEDPSYGDSPSAPEVEAPKKGGVPVLGYVLSGVGLVGIGVGSYFGVRAITLRKDSDQNCVGGCTPLGVDFNNQAKTAAWVSNFGIGLGAISAAVGAYILLKAVNEDSNGDKPSDEKKASGLNTLHVQPELGPTTAGLTLGGVW